MGKINQIAKILVFLVCFGLLLAINEGKVNAKIKTKHIKHTEVFVIGENHKDLIVDYRIKIPVLNSLFIEKSKKKIAQKNLDEFIINEQHKAADIIQKTLVSPLVDSDRESLDLLKIKISSNISVLSNTKKLRLSK